MAAGGMGRPDDRLRASLAERGRPDSASTASMASSAGTALPQRPDEGRPCWVLIGPARAEGTIHAWWRDESSGRWHALVIAWLPAESVSRRT